MNYFTAIVPKVEEFNKKFVETGRIKNLKELVDSDISKLREIWKNKRSWIIAKEIASYLSTINEDDKVALRAWARNASLEKWKGDSIGRIKGVGPIAFQYLRMMGGVIALCLIKSLKR